MNINLGIYVSVKWPEIPSHTFRWWYWLSAHEKKDCFHFSWYRLFEIL